MVIKTKVTGHYSGGSVTDNFTGNVTYGAGKVLSETQSTFFSPGPPYVLPNRWDHWVDNLKPAQLTGRYITNFSNPGKYSRDYLSYNLGYAPVLWEPKDDPHHVDLVNAALANVNPNKPVVDLPLFLFEFREVPKGIRDLGNMLIDLKRGRDVNVADAYLGWSFGWKPLLNDLLSLSQLADSFERRLAFLRKASTRERVERTLYHTSEEEKGPILKTLGYLEYRYHSKLSEKAWFTCNYRFDSSQLADLDSSPLNRLKLALGLRASFTTVWNAIPWSWLIDYFGNIGDFLATHQGHYKAEITDMCTMYEFQRTHDVVDVYSSHRKTDSLDVTTGGSKFKFQSRRVHANPNAKLRFFPLLTNRQLSILSALSASRSTTFLRGG